MEFIARRLQAVRLRKFGLIFGIFYIQLLITECRHGTKGRKPAAHTSSDESHYPFAAYRDGVRDKIRIYGQYHTSTIRRPPGMPWQVNDEFCGLYGENGRHEIVKAVAREVIGYDEMPKIPISDWVFDCEGSHTWAQKAVARLSNGVELGSQVEISTMGTEKKGKVAACSQPLTTNRDWLEDWVDHYLNIGVTEIYMHVPQGSIIDELFNDKRTERIGINNDFGERSPDLIGKERLKKFNRPKNSSDGNFQVHWIEYWLSPISLYHAEEFVFSMCQYRLRYEYDYVLQFDVDEWFYLNAPTDMSTFSLPKFLDKEFPENAATLAVYQKGFPRECEIKKSGIFASRFTLGEPWVNQPKQIVRPLSVFRMHVHAILGVSEEWEKMYGSDWEQNLAQVSIRQAYLKHIRQASRIENGVLTYPLCSFGPESFSQGVGSQYSIFY